MNTTEVQPLSQLDLAEASGGLAPIAVFYAAYLFTGPTLAFGVARGVHEAQEAQQ